MEFLNLAYYVLYKKPKSTPESFDSIRYYSLIQFLVQKFKGNVLQNTRALLGFAERYMICIRLQWSFIRCDLNDCDPVPPFFFYHSSNKKVRSLTSHSNGFDNCSIIIKNKPLVVLTPFIRCEYEFITKTC